VTTPFAAASAPLKGLLICALLVAPTAASAGDPAPEDKTRKLLTREVLLSMDEVPRREVPFRNRFHFSKEQGLVYRKEVRLAGQEEVGASLHLSKKRGLLYRQQLRLGDQDVGLRIYGPLVKKKPGMGIQLEGLAIGDRPVDINAFGNTKRGRIVLEVKF
jgi:hypothetical protein